MSTFSCYWSLALFQWSGEVAYIFCACCSTSTVGVSSLLYMIGSIYSNIRKCLFYPLHKYTLPSVLRPKSWEEYDIIMGYQIWDNVGWAAKTDVTWQWWWVNHMHFTSFGTCTCSSIYVNRKMGTVINHYHGQCTIVMCKLNACDYFACNLNVTISYLSFSSAKFGVECNIVRRNPLPITWRIIWSMLKIA